MATARLAVVLFNLGGPDGPDAVRPFLFNLFRDPAIIGAPALLRYPLAALIAALRTPSAKANYAHMGGGSPLVPETQAQAEALQAALAARLPDTEIELFIAMRYWRPFSAETAAAVAAFAPDEIVLLPLYPQFSTTTTASSLAAWKAVYRGPGRARAVCCYPTLEGFVEAHARRLEAAWDAAGRPAPVRLIFSAHGLPESVVEAGDPYASQVAATAEAVAARLPAGLTDWRIAYQSRVGPMKWLGPTTLEEIEAAAKQGVGVVISPIAFVSEHVETLVELDRDYRRRAEAAGIAAYVRAPTLGVEAAFVDGLAGLVAAALGRSDGIAPGSGFTCAAAWSKCPYSDRGEA
ncbi:MAG TPA: ferrochelatase [Caulobacteraceae bacterium]|jgi:ferrochelatase|nr:ferrochelatase [Caulobacteraceae bacterium]